MKVYRCDACGCMVEDPHDVEMKEFTFTEEIDEYGLWVLPIRRKVKIHLCSGCFKGLSQIADKKIHGGNDDER